MIHEHVRELALWTALSPLLFLSGLLQPGGSIREMSVSLALSVDELAAEQTLAGDWVLRLGVGWCFWDSRLGTWPVRLDVVAVLGGQPVSLVYQ